MMDVRRHSVDIPISKTLLALRRVRSLRDPSTNSLSKFSALVDNLNWETNSSHGITIGFPNGYQESSIENNNISGTRELGMCRTKDEIASDLELFHGSGKNSSKLISCEDSVCFGNTNSAPARAGQLLGTSCCGSHQSMFCENKSLRHGYCDEYKDNGLDLTCITPNGCLEGLGSCNEPVDGSFQAERMNQKVSKEKFQCKRQVRLSRMAVGDVVSRVGSPCLSISDAQLEGSSQNTSLYGNEDLDVVDHNRRGCGIRCCWSRTPRFRESNLPTDVDDQPLLSGEMDKTPFCGQGKSWKHISNDIVPYSESPRSICLKFRPKSFNELVGQNAVARSLLSAISNGRTTSFYLFHGPHGTGKTSASRIFAAALNCLSLEEHRPCGLCRECILFFSGRSKDVKEVDSIRINRTDRIRSLIKSAVISPVSSRFKVFIFDECHLLRGETWALILNNLDDLSQHVVFVMITADLGKLPRGAVSRSQRYHFPKIKEADIANRLRKICVEEGLDFDLVALDFIATKSNGSLRDAEMMLEQLSLLGKRITVPLAYELIGIVSDDELLDLLHLALSSDTSNTVRRARELMRSKIDPMQLISQLANLIMDILAGKCQESTSEVRRKFSERHSSEADLQQLSHALKILSETEKQLRASKNQSTWLTVALLQLSSVGSSSLDANDSRLSVRMVHPRVGDFCSTSSMDESLKHLVTCARHNTDSQKVGIQDSRETLESTWTKATEICQSSSLRNFLRKHGKLSSICFSNGLAIAELEFYHPDHVSKAEKSWKLIASSLQSILGCNIEIRINLVHCVSMKQYAKVKKPSFSLFSCSRRMHHGTQSTTERGSDPSDNSDITSEKAMIRNRSIGTCSSDCGSQVSHGCFHRTEAAKTIRNSEGNALSIGVITPASLLPEKCALGVCSSKEDEGSCQRHAPSAQETDKQPGCFSRTWKRHKKLQSSNTSQMVCSRVQAPNNLNLPIPGETSKTYCHLSDPCFFCNNPGNCNSCSREEFG